ncbi:MAG: hypothetical protein ACR2P3_06080 [Geminicoccaceae bacterium]
MSDDDLISINNIPCCPKVTSEPCCEKLQFAYRLQHRLTNMPVEVVVVAELERCPGPLALGDVVYSTTLLPGERVRLYTSSRNNRFSYDSESEVNYRHEQASEETFYMSSMDHFMSDLTVTDQGSSSSSSSSDFEVDTSGSYGTIGFYGRGSASVEGEFNASRSADFMRELSRHSESSHERSVQATRAANSIAIGEVQSRTHAEGESESAYEASTRILENKNQCHAVTYFAYQLVKRQTIRFRIKAILRRAVDPVGSLAVDARPARPSTGISIIPDAILAAKAERLELETAGRTSAAAHNANVVSTVSGTSLAGGFGGVGVAVAQPRLAFETVRVPPISRDEREAAVQAVDDQLVEAGILDENGKVADGFRAELEYERTICLPTQAIVVKGCLDDCNVCEKALQKSIDLDLDRKKLENELLKRQIDLLDQAQEYRCCPVGEEEMTGSSS